MHAVGCSEYLLHLYQLAACAVWRLMLRCCGCLWVCCRTRSRSQTNPGRSPTPQLNGSNTPDPLHACKAAAAAATAAAGALAERAVVEERAVAVATATAAAEAVAEAATVVAAARAGADKQEVETDRKRHYEDIKQKLHK